MSTTEEQLAKLAVGNSREVIERQAERIAELERENKRLDDHAKKWGIKAQQAEQQLTEAQAEIQALRKQRDAGQWYPMQGADND